MSKKFIICLGIIILIVVAGVIWWYQKPAKQELEVVKKGKLVVGTDATYPPMEYFNEQGNFVGMDIDIAKEIALDLGIQTEFRNIVWEGIFNTLLAGEVDILVSAITITPERAEIMDFSDPYFNAGQVVMVMVNKVGEIKGVEDLTGKTIGVQTGTTSEIEAKKYTDPALVIAFADYDLAKSALLTQAIDAIIIDYPAAVGMVSEEKTLKVVGAPFTQEFYGIAVKKGEKELLEEINKTIRRLKRDGKLKEFEEKWLSAN
ncbi:MAG: basic amino acid ABC transporter substrate-binding protein [Candidatus Pacebacteria bacterium]|nr:basic amino acid ABC transporter substrate-binding protein [Candidatus Paceibacterota bacterium]